MASATTPLSNTDHGETNVISAVHRDIIEHNILGRLDGLSLASLSCTSSYFNMLSSEESLWRKVCTSAWPSINHPRVHRLISAVPNGHCRFFSDSFPLLTPHEQVRHGNYCPTFPSEIVSAVDIWYQDKLIFSRVLESETMSDVFLRSSFRVNLLDPKEVHPATRVKKDRDGDTWLTIRELEENLTLSWIIFDPVTQKSANFSSITPVSSERHWNPGEYDIEYATILGSERVAYVECKVVVTCGGLDQGELHIKEACLRVKNMDGNHLNGKESLRYLVNAIEFGKRKTRRSGDEGKNMHEEYLKRKRLIWDKRVRRERVLAVACSSGVAVVGVGVCIVGGVGVGGVLVYNILCQMIHYFM